MRGDQAFRYISKQFTYLLVGFLLTSGFARNSNSETGYWAYQPVELPALPAVKNSDWIKNPIVIDNQLVTIHARFKIE